MAKTAKKKKGATKKGATKKAVSTAVTVDAKGIADLHGIVGLSAATKGTANRDAIIATLPLKSIRIVDGFNPRASLGDLDMLAENIKRDGLLHDIVVRPARGKPGSYDVVAGERRLRAVRKLKWKEVLCKVRIDLAGNDERSIAVAVAENSEDLNTHLNAIEIGRVVQRLTKKSWTVNRIAAECGLHPQKVRRCITLMHAPDDVQKRVESGDISMNAGLEIAKLDEKTRSKIKKALEADIKGGEQVSRASVKRMAKQAAQADGATGQAGKKANKQKGQSRDAALTAWQGSRSKQKTIAYLANLMVTCPKDEIGTTEYYEVRGSLAALLWDRGDIDGIHLPPIVEKECETGAEKKLLKKINGIIVAEAKNHKSDKDDEE